MVACDGFAICCFIAELTGRNPRNFWPFSEESFPKSRWWSCPRCTSNIDADGTEDTGLPSNSAIIVSSRNGLNGSSSVIPSQNTPNSPTAIDQEKEMNTDHITVNAAVENETVNCERSQQDDQTGNAAVVNEDVNCETSQKNNKRVTRSSKKVHPPPVRTYALRNKSKRVAVPEPVGNKRGEKQNVEQLALTILASAVVEDAQPKASESRSLYIGGVPCRKTRTVRTRRLKDLTDKPVINNTRREEPSSQKESLRGKKRKSPPGSSKRGRKVSTGGEISGSVFFNVDSEHGGSERTDSGPDIDHIKGKKKNVRFQVDDDDDEAENDVDPNPPMAKRTTKVKKMRTRSEAGPSKKAFSSLQTIIEEEEPVPSPPRDQITEERVANSLDDQLASDGYDETQDNSRTRSGDVVGPSYVPAFGSSSIPSTSRGLGDGTGALYFGSSSNNNENNQRSTPPSTVVADQSSVPHKDGSVSDRKGKGVMVQSNDETENTQNNALPNKEVNVSNNIPQEVPPKPKNPLMFDLNETYEEDVPSMEDNTNAAREEEEKEEEEDSDPTEPEQNSVEISPPRQITYMPSPSVLMPPPVQETRPSSILFPGHNPRRMGNRPMTTHHHHHHHHPYSYPSPYQVVGVPPQYIAPSPPVWASPSMMPPQYHHHHHHHSPPAPFNVDYSSLLAQQAQRSDTWNNLIYYEPNSMNQAMMSPMDPRFRPNTPVNHHGNSFFTPRHVSPVNQYISPVNQYNSPVNQYNSPVNHHGNNFFTPRHVSPVNQYNSPVNQYNSPVNQFRQLLELQHSHERAVYPRTNSNQGRFQRMRSIASSNNASALHAENSTMSSACIVNRYPGEISDIEPGNVYMVRAEDLHVPERMAEFGQESG
ncbi:unnamed protein product [Eruca vesicaria subsp. sativa]|uniref:Uncharacterized protein n=1 Tax=Eruca vesicaria subsp. sativa TaxID=29727 RepID=A0ABC8ITR4_ERUVS|nr:unnamed protein product [Eruca vesicaria subsp. sativa]